MREVIIDAVGAQGDGLVRQGPVFVPLTLPGERVTVKMDGSRGELVDILDASPDRVAPCKHFGECGGCTSQHWAQQPYLDWKADLVRLQLSHEGLETEILPTFAAPAASRRRVALHARGGKGGVRLGFKERRSWNLVKIEECPVADPRLVAASGPCPSGPAVPGATRSRASLHVTLRRPACSAWHV